MKIGLFVLVIGLLGFSNSQANAQQHEPVDYQTILPAIESGEFLQNYFDPPYEKSPIYELKADDYLKPIKGPVKFIADFLEKKISADHPTDITIAMHYATAGSFKLSYYRYDCKAGDYENCLGALKTVTSSKTHPLTALDKHTFTQLTDDGRVFVMGVIPLQPAKTGWDNPRLRYYLNTDGAGRIQRITFSVL